MKGCKICGDKLFSNSLCKFHNHVAVYGAAEALEIEYDLANKAMIKDGTLLNVLMTKLVDAISASPQPKAEKIKVMMGKGDQLHRLALANTNHPGMTFEKRHIGKLILLAADALALHRP